MRLSIELGDAAVAPPIGRNVIETSTVVAQVVVGENLLADAILVVVLSAFAAALSCGMGILYRWYADDRVPDGLSVLVGLSAIALYLNTVGALGEIIGGYTEFIAVDTAVFNVITFAIAGAAAAGGGRAGDRIGISLAAVSGRSMVDADVSRLVTTVGRVTTVRVPDDVGDIDGYDPVDAATKEKLAGQTLVFPRRLTVEELRTRFVERLQTDYGVGHVDVDFTPKATIEYLAVGSRASGIGPTLPPGSAALAVRTDPANSASPGDVVQLWTGGGEPPKRVINGELRGIAGDVATLAMDADEARQLDTTPRYRLVTLPVEPRADREFAAQLRSAAETMGVVSVVEGSPLAGGTIGALDVAVVAIRSADGTVEAIPRRSRSIVPGETIYAIARPDRLRRLEEAVGRSAAGGERRDTATVDD